MTSEMDPAQIFTGKFSANQTWRQCCDQKDHARVELVAGRAVFKFPKTFQRIKN